MTRERCAEEGREAARRLAQALDTVETEEGLLVKLGTLVYEAEEACTRSRAPAYIEAALSSPAVAEKLRRLGPRVLEKAVSKAGRDPRYRQLRPYHGLLARLLLAPGGGAAAERHGRSRGPAGEALARLLEEVERLGPRGVFAAHRLGEWSGLAPLYGEAAQMLAERGAPRETVAAVVAGLIRSAAWGPVPRC